MCEKSEQNCEGQGLSQGALDVLAERRRQIDVEGWTPEHDDGHAHGEMAQAAASYCFAASDQPTMGKVWWPWSSEWWKPAAPRRMLVKAAALIIAEIERLDRAEARK